MMVPPKASEELIAVLEILEEEYADWEDECSFLRGMTLLANTPIDRGIQCEPLPEPPFEWANIAEEWAKFMA